MPRLVVNLVAKTGSVDDGQRDAGTFLIQLELWSPRGQLSRTGVAQRGSNSPTVTGLMRTPSSMWALAASSASLPSSTCLPQRVFTKVVRPEGSSGQLAIAIGH